MSRRYRGVRGVNGGELADYESQQQLALEEIHRNLSQEGAVLFSGSVGRVWIE